MRSLKSGIFSLVVLSVVSAVPVPFAVDENLRLPQTSFPISYDLTLTTSVHDNGARNFTGTVTILLEIKETTRVITLHNRGLEINSVVLRDNANQIVSQTRRDEIEKEFLHIESVGDLLLGSQFRIEIIFNGLLNLERAGFYRSSYRVGSEFR